jgi:hypothetical protein
MPHADQLPDNLKDLAYRNSVEITHARWNSDVQLLIQALTQYVHTTRGTEGDIVHATVPVQLPAPHPAPEAATVQTKSKTPLIAGLVVLGVVVIALVVFVALRPSPVGGLNGNWTNPAAAERDALAHLEISGSSRQLAIHAWGLCKPANCDWGTQTAPFDGQKAKATWSMLNNADGQEKGRVATVTISAGSPGKLEVVVANTYPQHPGNTHQFEFVQAQ